MNGLSIGEVARRAGVRPSALRYYEQVGLISPQLRESGQRRYDPGIFNRLAVIAYAKEVGFTIADMKVLMSGAQSRACTPTGNGRASGIPSRPPERWHALALRKRRELDDLIVRANRMKRLLDAALQCRCLDLDDCGRRLRGRTFDSLLNPTQ